MQQEVGGMNLFIAIGFVLLVIQQLFSPCAALRGYGDRGYGNRGAKVFEDPGKPKALIGTSPGIPGHNTMRRGLGISAWGIVIVIVTLILAGMGFYYFSMCYPILCKKSRKYDMMGLPTVA